MAFYHQAVKIQINCFLRKFLKNIPASANMGWIANHHQVRISSFHLDSHMPHGGIAIFGITESTESTMDEANILNSGFYDPLDRTHPKFYIRVQRIFN